MDGLVYDTYNTTVTCICVRRLAWALDNVATMRSEAY